MDQNKLIALALYEIRTLLSSKLGRENEADMPTRLVAHLASALHNEAQAVIEGKEFDVETALNKVKAIDKIVNEEYSADFIRQYNESSV